MSERLSEERLRAFAGTRGLVAVMAREVLELRADLAATTEDEVKFRAKWSDAEAEVERLREALLYWLPDESMIPAGHEDAWNRHAPLVDAAALKDSEEGSDG